MNAMYFGILDTLIGHLEAGHKMVTIYEARDLCSAIEVNYPESVELVKTYRDRIKVVQIIRTCQLQEQADALVNKVMVDAYRLQAVSDVEEVVVMGWWEWCWSFVW